MRYLYWLGLITVVFLTVLIAPNTYYLYTIGTIAITTLVGVGLNILTGLSGQISIGHAGFFAIGAYTGSLLMTKLQWNFWLATAIAIMTAAVTGIALAAPALRVKGPYLAMVTVAFGIIIERILIEWVDLTGGFGGIFNIPKPMLFNLQPALRDVVLLAWIAAILALMSFAALKSHPWGKAWQAVRDDEIAATALGLNALRIRLMAFAVSAAFTGLGGVFFASIVGFISPDSFNSHRSILFLLVVILGGLGTIAGALVGAIALVIFPELLGNFAEYQLLVFGILLLLTLWLTPEGVVSFFVKRLRRSNPVYPPEMSLEDLPALVVKNQNDLPLEVKQMAISFGGIKAVNNVDLVAQSGTITSVIGPNGAGKTTLLNLLTGFYRPESGSVYLGKLNLTNQNTPDIVRAGLSRTFQTTRLFNSLSVLDNLQVACTGDNLGNILTALLGRGEKQQSSTESKLKGLLAFIGYRGDIHAPADSLSFGDRRLVEIARALATSPQVLLLDEPAAGLAQQQRDWLAKLFRRLANAGIKVIAIEHDMNLVMQISDRVVVLDRGQVICSGTPAQVQSDRRVLDAYLGVQSDNLNRASTSSTTPILTVENLVAGYDKLQVLQEVSLEVRQGELVAVIGANGAGKTTLLKNIAQLLRPQSGRVLFRDRDLRKLAPQKLSSKGIVLIPEGRQVFKELTTIDNLRLGAFYRRDSKIETDIDAMFDRFPALKVLQNQQAGLLSGGEQQMLAIARGLMARPQIVLLDEPSLGLAPQLVASLYETLASLCDEGISILLVDQMAQLALSVAHRLYVLETGKIIQAGTPEELSRDSRIIDSYLGNLRSSEKF
ncbi:Abc transporter [Hyella patelloides LEGE 07179]|uniref:Abc transporter n=1 Tax=Hyella patelloides LEGE 07179 TaxID=945734 RepID=A0A563VUQ2_9CYAN|nr:branched-chain amino acid ABC transporter ATP-binding protein/permease [Hyella patelloides]VEP15202.1 Abc transporter [Hyella patelloides LEGE 07179]